MEKEQTIHIYLEEIFKSQNKNKLLSYFNHILYRNFEQPTPQKQVMIKQQKKTKVKCLYCKKEMKDKPNSNVCSQKCAFYLSKKITKKLELKTLKQRQDWEQSPYYPLVKDYEEKVIEDYKKNKIPNKIINTPDYSVFKKPSLNDLDELMEENYKEKNELKMALLHDCCKVSKCCQIPKGWGHELIIHNSPEYCGKILVFKRGCKFSMHYHILKQETWYVNKGTFTFTYIDTVKAITHKRTLKLGDVVTIKRGMPHQLLALEDGEIFEISTEHFDTDSYRISKGD